MNRAPVFFRFVLLLLVLYSGVLRAQALDASSVFNDSNGSIPVPRASVTEPTFTVDHTDLNFGKMKIGTSDTLTLTITNISEFESTLVDSIIGPHSPFSIASSDEPTLSLPQLSAGTVHIVFNPKATGPYMDSIVLRDNSKAGRTVIPISGVASEASVKSLQDFFTITVSPNPAIDHFAVNLNLEVERSIKLSLIDEAGVPVVALLDEAMPPGLHIIECPTRDLVNGNYLVRLESAGELYSTKVVVRH